jgi:hypothetical protein
MIGDSFPIPSIYRKGVMVPIAEKAPTAAIMFVPYLGIKCFDNQNNGDMRFPVE